MHNWKKIIGGFLVAGMFVLFGCGGGEEGGGSAVPSQSNTVKVVPTGSGTYSIQGNNLNGVAGIQLDIVYDAASLASPKVTQGSLAAGALLASNTSQPGLIKIAIISTNPLSGSGQLAAIAFATITGSGGITSITASMIDSNGAPIASSAGI
jgi:hypothetical protein